MVTAIKDPEKCPEALEDLMHTTFVHPVDASSLSIIVPILSRCGCISHTIYYIRELGREEER